MTDKAAASDTQPLQPPADEETGLRSDGHEANGTPAANACFSACLTFWKVVFSIPFMIASMLGIAFFYTLYAILYPVQYVLTQMYGFECMVGLFAWLKEGAKLPIAMAKWAIS